MLHETDTTDIALLSSFRYEYLQRARLLHPNIALAVLAEEHHPPSLLHYLNRVSACAYHPAVDMCANELILQLKQEGIRVNAWTVNNYERAEELHSLGAGVITDWPQLFDKKREYYAK